MPWTRTPPTKTGRYRFCVTTASMRKAVIILALTVLVGCGNLKNGRETWTGGGTITRSKPATSSRKMKTEEENTLGALATLAEFVKLFVR